MSANLQVQQSTYIGTAHKFRNVEKVKISSSNERKLQLRQAPISDLLDAYPEAVIASSQALGWQNLRAMQVHQGSIEWNLPPFENHCVIIQTGPPLQLSAIIDGHTFDQRVETGEIIIIPAGVASHWQLNDATSNDALHLYLSPKFVQTTASLFDLDQGQISIEPQFGVDDEHIQHIGMSLLYELMQPNIVGRYSADALANVLAMQLVRRYSYLRDVQTSRGGMAPRKLRRTLEFINENLEKEQTVAVAAVAEEAEMSYFHFSRAFKQSMGVSPNVYMIEQRIEQAKKLLAETDLPIVEIALRVGFASQGHFSTTFRRLAWTTPKAFRNMQ